MRQQIKLSILFFVFVSICLNLFADDPRQDLVNAFMKLETAYPYRLTETSSTAGPQNVNVQNSRILEMAGPEDFHLKWTSGNSKDLESISLKGKSYYKLNGKWVDTPVSAPVSTKQNRLKTEDLVKIVKDVKVAGTENLNGTNCLTYIFQLNAAEMGMKGNGKTWIGTSDGLPRKTDMVLNTAGYEVKSVLVYEFDKSIRVVPPQMN